MRRTSLNRAAFALLPLAPRRLAPGRSRRADRAKSFLRRHGGWQNLCGRRAGRHGIRNEVQFQDFQRKMTFWAVEVFNPKTGDWSALPYMLVVLHAGCRSNHGFVRGDRFGRKVISRRGTSSP
jgi:hypothetical protein